MRQVGEKLLPKAATKFQYRKRYEVTCDQVDDIGKWIAAMPFQYRKRYEVTCDPSKLRLLHRQPIRFNTASGMRSHVTMKRLRHLLPIRCFNTASGMRSHVTPESQFGLPKERSFNTASGMRSHVTSLRVC